MKFKAFSYIFLILILVLINFQTLMSSSYIIKFTENNKNKNDNILNLNLKIKYKKVFDYSTTNSKYAKILSSESSRYLNELGKYYVAEIQEDSIYYRLKNNSAIESIQDNYIFQVDGSPKDNTNVIYSLKENQWDLDNINAKKAWKIATGKGIIIGLVDSGVELTHPDFTNQLYINPAEDINHNGKFDNWPSTEIRDGVSGDLDGIDEDGNGFVDDVCGYNFVDTDYEALGNSQGRDPQINDDNGHGTSVAGVMCANNSNGLTGIAYNAKILPLKAIDLQGNGEADDIAAAIVYGAMNGAKILNMSFGETFDSELIHSAIKFAESLGVFVAASSGNNNSNRPHFPSDYEEVCSVGASTKESQKWSLSNYGNNLDIVAPGSSVMTTKWGATYGDVSGTSIASPHVSAVAALILEKNPGLKPHQIKDILKSSAKDIDVSGWDLQTASGLVDAYAALQFNGMPELSISYPNKYSFYSNKTIKKLPVIGTIAVPLFDSYSIFIGEGLYPSQWDTLVYQAKDQIINDTLALIDISKFETSYYTTYVSVKQKDNLEIMKRLSFAVSAEKNILQFETLNIIYPIVENKRAVLIAAKGTVNSRFYIKYKIKNTEDNYSFASETDHYSTYHTVLLDDHIEPETTYEAIAILEADNGETSEMNFEFFRHNSYFREDLLNNKTYSLPPSAILNKVVTNTKDTVFAMNELNGPFWKNTKVMKFSNNIFTVLDSNNNLNNFNIPVDLGKDGDNIQFLTSANRTAYLFSGDQSGHYFKNKIFDSETIKFSPAGLVDIDNDGKFEIIGFSDTAFHCLKKFGTKFIQTAQTLPITNWKKSISSDPGFASGDFDGDGNQDICFMNYNGDIFIYSYINNKFQLQYSDTSSYTSNNVYFANPDVDGDGKPEILIGFPGDYELFGEEVGVENLWQYMLIKYTDNKQYEIVWKDFIYPVRSGITGAGYYYKNGLSAGNIDNEPGDEILLTPFPNLYAYKWDKSQNTMVPYIRYNGVFSNSSLVYDFDKNGINEFSLNTGDRTQFFEVDTSVKIEAPNGLTAISTDSGTVFLKWNYKTGANMNFTIWIKNGVVDSESPFVRYASTNVNWMNITNLENNKIYTFAVKVEDTVDSFESKFSDSIAVFVHDRIYVQTLESDSIKIIVHFSGKMSDKAYSPKLFSVVNGSQPLTNIYPVSSIKTKDNSIMLRFSEPLADGTYSLHLSGLNDYYNSEIRDTNINFEIINGVMCYSSLYLLNLNVINEETLLLKYSDKVETTSALNVENYKIEPTGKIFSIEEHGNEGNQVTINLDKKSGIGAFGNVYTLFVSDVKTLSGNVMTKGTGNSLSFVFLGNDLSKAFVYPNPINYNITEKATFGELPEKCKIEIYNLDFVKINTLESGKANGGIDWDCRDNKGKKLDSGIYLFKVIKINNDGSEIDSDLIKFAIVN